MSWSGIQNNNWVTNNDVLEAVADGDIVINSGQSVPANNNWITVNEANIKLDITPIAGTTTRWPVKSELLKDIPSCDLQVTFVSKTDESYTGADDGTITITASTSNPDGFLLSKNGGSSYPIPGTSPYTFTGLVPGSYGIRGITGDGTCETLVFPVVIQAAVATYYLAGFAYNGTTSAISCRLITGSTFPIYTTNSSGILNVSDYIYISNGSGGYKLLDIYYTYLSYNQVGTRYWIKPNTSNYALIDSKGTCKPNVFVGAGFENNIFGSKNAGYVSASVLGGVTSRLRVQVQYTGVNGEPGSPNPVIYHYIEIGGNTDRVWFGASKVNNGANCYIIDIAIMVGGVATYPAEDSNYVYIHN